MKIATVVNFPSGELPVETVVAETQQAIADGADEIDLVIPYRAFMAGDELGRAHDDFGRAAGLPGPRSAEDHP